MEQGSSNAQQQSATKSGSQMIDINLTFGDDGGQQTLAELKFHFFSMVSTKIDDLRQNFMKEIQSKDEDKNDSLLVFKFEVETGRERQSFEFIEKGLDQDQSNENTSEMQKLFRRPKTSGRIQMKQGKGYIYVIYRFYHQKILSQDLEEVDKLIQAKVDLDFTIDMVLKGKTEASRRSFTSIKSDFVKLRMASQKITMRDLLNFFQQKGEVDQGIMGSDFYKLLRNMQIAKFDLKFNSLRRIMRYYNRILNHEDDMEEISSKERVSPLSSKGIFRNFASLNFFLGHKIAFRGELNFKSEEIMMRLVARIVKMTQGL